MKTYKVGEYTIAIIDSQLWQRIEDVDSDGEEIEAEDDQPVVPAKKKTKKSRGILLTDEQKEEIRQKFSAGATKEKLAKEYKVSITSIYNFIPRGSPQSGHRGSPKIRPTKKTLIGGAWFHDSVHSAGHPEDR